MKCDLLPLFSTSKNSAIEGFALCQKFSTSLFSLLTQNFTISCLTKEKGYNLVHYRFKTEKTLQKTLCFFFGTTDVKSFVYWAQSIFSAVFMLF